MLYIRNDSLDPYYNLALEEYVLKNLDQEDSLLLLWQNSPSVIIGRFQNTIEEINQEYIQANSINVVRRITGGGAVYHDLGNLNFSFIVRNEHSDIDFARFTEPIVKALAKMGIQAKHTGRNDITIDDKKFSGNAQFHYRNKVLHHGTILFSSRLDDVQKALHVKPAKIQSKGVKSVRSRVTNIVDYLDQKVDIADFRDLLLFYLFEGEPLQEYTLSVEDLNRIQRLREEKYLTWEWNYGNSPAFNVIKSGRFPWGGIEFCFDVRHGIIENCKIYGDFFSNEDINELAKGLCGVRYCQEDLTAFLDSVNLQKYIPAVTKEEISSIIESC